MYSTYEDYAASGGTLSEAEFLLYARKACRAIDRATHNRLRGRSDPEALTVAACCAEELISLFAANADYGGRLVERISNDGLSVQYASGAEASDAALAAACIRAWFDGLRLSDGTHALYAGWQHGCDDGEAGA